MSLIRQYFEILRLPLRFILEVWHENGGFRTIKSNACVTSSSLRATVPAVGGGIDAKSCNIFGLDVSTWVLTSKLDIDLCIMKASEMLTSIKIIRLHYIRIDTVSPSENLSLMTSLLTLEQFCTLRTGKRS